MKKGIFYSILTIIIIIPIITLYSTYGETIKGYGTSIGSNVRMKSGLYFLDSINEDLNRAVNILGRRSITASVNHVINEGPLQSAEDTIRELIENKTINGTPSYIMDYTIYDWINKSDDTAKKRGFILKRDIKNIDITMEDSWNVIFLVDIHMKLEDKDHLFLYEKNLTKKIPVSILDMEDPLYFLNTGGTNSRKIKKQEKKLVEEIIDSGDGGNGWDSGISIVTNNPGSVQDPEKNILINNTINQDWTSFSGIIGDSNNTGLSIPYVMDNDWVMVPNQTRIVVDGDSEKVWVIENLYNTHKNKLYISGDGPSFLDRLEGKLKNTYPSAGLESFVKKEEMGSYSYSERSNVDYIYFNETISLNNYKIKGMTDKLDENFLIDQNHLSAYELIDLTYA